MKYYISEIIPSIQQFSKKLDENTLLTNNEWVQFNQDSLNKVNYIFKKKMEIYLLLNAELVNRLNGKI